ncbi:IbrB-like domain-containing protein [Enterococcus raffinosus]|uniref:IbrB-like domain-containing protein n=1 Tax=Enterococcus raffinosus TaxID=71452 RepID=UPI003AC0F34C
MTNISFPVLEVTMVDIKKIVANNYNPNKVAAPEMKLLELSIRQDGYTQPIVCFYDEKEDKYIIIDGYHRYYLAKEVFNLSEVPVTIIKKDLGNRMASTIRHNRARGKHTIDGMTSLIEEFIALGWSEQEIGKFLGMEKEEVIRLRQSTCLKKVFANHRFSESWSEFEKAYYS